MSDFAQDSDHTAKHSRPKRRRLAPAALIAGVAASAAIALSMTGALGAFTAQITNSTDNASSGYLTMSETTGTGGTAVTCSSTDGGSVSTNSATCATINKYGGSTNMTPGQSVSTTVVIKNTGTVTATTFTLTPGVCGQSNNGTSNNGTATTLCSQMTVALNTTIAGTTTNGTAATLAAFKTAGAITFPALAAGASDSFTFVVTLPLSVDNTFQGLTASQPLVWNFTS